MKKLFKHFSSALAIALVTLLAASLTSNAQLYDYRYASTFQYQFADIIETTDNSGNYDGHIAIGRQRWTSATQEGGIVMVKVNNVGDTVWFKRIRLSNGTTVSNALYNIQCSIALKDQNGNNAGYAIGVLMGTSPTPSYTSTSFIVRVDNDGNFLWARQLRNQFAINNGVAMTIGDMIQNSSGLITYVANSRDASITRNVCVGHFDLNGNGNLNWSRQFNSTPQYAGYSVAWDNLRIIETHDGSYAITGRATEYLSNWNFYRVGVMKINPDGTLNQLRYFDLNTQSPVSNNQPSFGTDIIQTDDDNDLAKDDGFAVLTNVRVAEANSQNIPALLKLDYNLNVMWYRAYPVIANTSYGGAIDLFQEKLFDTSNEYKFIFAAQEGSFYSVITTDNNGNILPAYSKRYNPGSFSGTQTAFNVNHDKSLSLVMNNGGIGRTNSLFNLPTCYNQTALSSSISITPWTYSSTFQRNFTWQIGDSISHVTNKDPLKRTYGCAVNCYNMQIAGVTTTDDSCAPGCDGALSIAVSGGTPSYTYTVNGVSGPSALTGLCADNYSVLVTDANQCTAVAYTSITGANSSLISNINLTSGIDQTSGNPLPLLDAEQLWQTDSGAVVMAGVNDMCTESQYIFDPFDETYTYCFCLNEESWVGIGMKISGQNGPVVSSALDGQDLFSLTGNQYGEDTYNNVPPAPWDGKLLFEGTLSAGTHCIEVGYAQWHSGFAGVAICGYINSDQLISPECCSQQSAPPSSSKMLLAKQEDNSVSLYPNPANDQLNLVLAKPSSIKQTYQVLDATGRIVLTSSIGEGISNIQIPTAELNNGFYTLRLVNLQTSQTVSFIVQH